jgi:predicted dehydrogenase
MSAPRLGVAVIGLHMGQAHFLAAIDHPQAELIAVCDKDEELTASIKAGYDVPVATTDWRELLDRPDVQIVSVCTPDWLHREMTCAFLDAGKHVMVEKPMAHTVEDCEAMIVAARRNNLKLMVAHVCRFYSFFEDAKRWSEDGTLGEIYYVETSYLHNYEEIGGVGGWRFDPEKRHPLVGGGCHAIDLARWMCGDADEVHAYGNHYNIPVQQWEDMITVNVKFQSGAIGRILNSSGCQRPYNIDLQLWGTKGTIQGDNTQDFALLSLRQVDRYQWLRLPKPTMAKAVASELGHFIDCVVHDLTPLIDGVDGAKTVALAWAAIESVKTGKPVKCRNEF